MQRRPAKTALSPKLLKHFAAATALATVLLAVITSQSDWGAQAQVEAVEAKNQLAQTEAEKLGTRRVATTLKIANGVGAASFGDDGGDFGGGGGSDGYAPRVPRTSTVSTAPASASFSGGSATPAAGGPDLAPPLPGSASSSAKARPSPAQTPSPGEIAQMTASSGQRSGAARSGD